MRDDAARCVGLDNLEHEEDGTLKLPNNEIGISDILQWRDCPARFVFGMKRHTQGAAPESWSPANAYGSAVHDMVHAIEEGATEDEAVQTAFGNFAKWLEPADVSLLHDDLQTYLERDPLGVRTIVAEEDHRFPLMEWEGETIYFRFRLDRLYQRLDDPEQFIHIDYKTSKHAKSQEQVDKDLQLWSYNLGIFKMLEDLYPEIEKPRVEQTYDQLRFGQLNTRKSAAQREEMERWLVAAVSEILKDETLAPSFNEWCPWCPLAMDCPVVQHELTDFATARIAALMPREPKKKKNGELSKVLGPPKLDPERFQEYAELLPDVKRAKQVLELFEETVRDAMKQMPSSALAEYKSSEAPHGYRRAERSRKGFSPDGLEAVYEQVGPAFWHMASLSGAAIERYFGDAEDAKERVAALMEIAEPRGGYEVIVPAREEV